MQTWLPFESFHASARALRTQELGRQRVDAKQLLIALLFPERKSMWRHHPAARMWRGYETQLNLYYMAVVAEWRRRRHKHTMELGSELHRRVGKLYANHPWWLGQPMFHDAQQGALIRRNSVYQTRLPESNIFVEHTNTPVLWPVLRDGTKHRFLDPIGPGRDLKLQLQFL